MLKQIPKEIKEAFDSSSKYFPTLLQLFQYYDKYARFNYDLGRREVWEETVDRSVNYLKELSENKLPVEEYERIRKFVLEMKATPSMRLLAMAGPAARKTNIAIYNCSYLPMDSLDAFVEELIIAMAGCGVGFSCERQYVDKLPLIPKRDIQPSGFITHHIEDSTEGWAEAFRMGLTHWFDGWNNLLFDYSKIRKAGVPLKIKGGRASGPEPFESLLNFSRDIILSRAGEKLRPIDAHRIACKIGEAIVSGGVRRTALISLFDEDDEEMRNCKNKENISPELWMANNSAVWKENVSDEQITRQMIEMHQGQRGEPGIFSRYNANKLRPDRRLEYDYGVNPCGEINLRPYEFCNLSIAIARPSDTFESLKEKVEVASVIGTIQSMATNFPGLRPIWKKNCEEERLLGVDINGWRDSELLSPSNPELPIILQKLRGHAVSTNAKIAKILGINPAAAVTCVKPSGNSGILFDSSSGLHARWAPYYIRRVRIQAKSPIAKVLKGQGVTIVPESGQTWENATTLVASFLMKSPENTLVKNDLSAIDQCEYWLIAKKYWTEHNPSVTITYQEEEFNDLLQWVIAHKEWIGGMSFLPASNAKYDLMPNEEISKEEYEKMMSTFPVLDFSKIWLYEKSDMTEASTELACVSGACSIEEYRALQSSNELGLT